MCHWQKCCGPPLSVDFAAFKLHRRGGLQHSPPSTVKVLNIHIQACQSQFRRSFYSFHFGFSENWSWNLEKRRRCCKAQTNTTYLHPVQLIFAWSHIMACTGLEFLFVFVQIVCLTGKSAVDPTLLLILQPSNCTEGGVCSTPPRPL